VCEVQHELKLVTQALLKIDQVSTPEQPDLAQFHRGFGAQAGWCPGHSIILFRKALLFQMRTLEQSRDA
jgi:hypothetical protein